MDIRDIIKRCGGAPHIADELKRLAGKDPVTYRIAGVKAIYKWADSGIPERHWALVMRLSDLCEGQIYQANRDLEKRLAVEKSDSQKRKVSTRVAA